MRIRREKERRGVPLFLLLLLLVVFPDGRGPGTQIRARSRRALVGVTPGRTVVVRTRKKERKGRGGVSGDAHALF